MSDLKKLRFSITIDAPPAKVWSVMLDKPTYQEWTAPFNPEEFSGGSSYEGSWEQGSTIKFLGEEADGSVSGMIAEIAENRPAEFLSIRHLAEVVKGEERKPDWSGQAYENYTLTPVDDGTRVDVEVDSDATYAEMFTELWPQALAKLKEVAERN